MMFFVFIPVALLLYSNQSHCPLIFIDNNRQEQNAYTKRRKRLKKTIERGTKEFVKTTIIMVLLFLLFYLPQRKYGGKTEKGQYKGCRL